MKFLNALLASISIVFPKHRRKTYDRNAHFLIEVLFVGKINEAIKYKYDFTLTKKQKTKKQLF